MDILKPRVQSFSSGINFQKEIGFLLRRISFLLSIPGCVSVESHMFWGYNCPECGWYYARKQLQFSVVSFWAGCTRVEKFQLDVLYADKSVSCNTPVRIQNERTESHSNSGQQIKITISIPWCHHTHKNSHMFLFVRIQFIPLMYQSLQRLPQLVIDIHNLKPDITWTPWIRKLHNSGAAARRNYNNPVRGRSKQSYVH